MSRNRPDCEHNHGADVARIAQTIATEHGLVGKIAGAVLVIVAPVGSEVRGMVVGQYNTAVLADAADLVLSECAAHEPDGCPGCDDAARAATLALEDLRDAGHILKRQRG